MTSASSAAPSVGATSRFPALFMGHGSPMNAVEDNAWSRGFTALGAALPVPRAILCVSAHWYVRGTHVTSNAAPELIYDFSGFPRALYEVRYPARGDAELAQRITSLLADVQATGRSDWGLDHGTWSLLVKLRPQADVPVLQLSIDRLARPAAHLAIGRALAPLREQGILLLGSGNITHNLAHALGGGGRERPDWAERFDRDVATALEQRDTDFLVRALETDDGRRAHPSADHYLPLLYVAGAAHDADRVSYPITGFDLGSLSMRSVSFA
ncbi:MAG: 4,5-DOPA dioxygenase extradiol [Myxococcales bacterium]|nr:4,5-DOPA dioxygenase extradiol [Myxococcales bacterium]